MATEKPDQKLEDLPNIGPKVAELLRNGGISSGKELRKAGSVEAARETTRPC